MDGIVRKQNKTKQQLHRFRSCAEVMYLRAYVMEPDEPLISFLLALTYAHISQARRAIHKPMSILQALTFLSEYRRLRDDGSDDVNAEISYNFGRFYQYCNLPHLAAPLYEQVLTLANMSSTKDLRRDAAYNLAQLYSDAGATKHAIRIISKYLQF